MRAVVLAVACCLCTTGCGRVSYQLVGSSATDAGLGSDAGGPPDGDGGGGRGEGGVRDGGGAFDGGESFDGGEELDSGGSTASGRCPVASGDAIALYPFEAGSPLDDVAGAHDGEIVGPGTLGTTDGPDGCGQALAFTGPADTYVMIPDSPDWDLAEGSVDFWVRFDNDASAGFWAMATRDASGVTLPGHLSVYRVQDGRIAARLQSTTTTVMLCANGPASEGDWIHVGVNFGSAGFELFIDGERATGTGEIVFDSPTTTPDTYTCGGSIDVGIDGNDNPWMIGVNGGYTAEGATTPVYGEWFRDGALDHFRVSPVRRDFSAYAGL